MANYTVHLTFSAPALQRPVELKHPIPGGGGSVRLTGEPSLVAAVVVLEDQQTPALAAVRAADEVARAWRLHGRGPITLLTWTATRRRVLAGLRAGADRASGTGSTWPFGDGGPDDGGLAGVREPRRPTPGPPSIGMTLPLD